MKTSKLKKRLATLISVLLIGWGLLLISNYFNYKSVIPSSYGDSYWSGKWESNDYWLITGRIIADLPEEIVPDEEIEFKATIYYNLWSLFRSGERQEIILIGKFSDQNTEGDNEDNPTETNYKVQFSLKNPEETGVSTRQDISYNGKCNADLSEVTGMYYSKNPGDKGEFFISK